MCTYIKQFLYILFLNSLACTEHLPGLSTQDYREKPPSTSTTVKCLRRFLKRRHGLIVGVSRFKLDQGCRVENRF